MDAPGEAPPGGIDPGMLWLPLGEDELELGELELGELDELELGELELGLEGELGELGELGDCDELGDGMLGVLGGGGVLLFEEQPTITTTVAAASSRMPGCVRNFMSKTPVGRNPLHPFASARAGRSRHRSC